MSGDRTKQQAIVLEKPNLADESLVRCLQDAYGLRIDEIAFLPLGADVDTAVYRATSPNGERLFVKLRRGEFNRSSILVPKLLSEHGVTRVIAPIPTADGRLWTRIEGFTLVLYPFVDGQSGFDRALSDEQWIELGMALKQLHSMEWPAGLLADVPRETYSPYWRDLVRGFQRRAASETFEDPAAAKLAEILDDRCEVVSELVSRAEHFAASLANRQLDTCLCHADIHAGNVLIGDGGELFVIDWDTLTVAPRERDLMFIGAGIGDAWNTEREKTFFYQGYGDVDIDRDALAYFRCERVVQDIAEFGKQLLLNTDGDEDRWQALHYFASQFEPGGVLEIALRTEPRL